MASRAAAINPSLHDKPSYDTQKDLAPVALVVNNVELLVANPANPAKDAAEFIANSTKRKDPTPMASSGIGSIPHFAIEQLSDSSGANLMHVPYKGAAPAITDLMAGQVDGFFGDIPCGSRVSQPSAVPTGFGPRAAPCGSLRMVRRPVPTFSSRRLHSDSVGCPSCDSSRR